MLQLKVNNEFLDIETEQVEMEKNSPLFLDDNELIEYSTPISIKYSEKNARLLSYQYMEQTVKRRLSIPVDVYENGIYTERAMLVIDSSFTDYNFKERGSLTGTLYTGISEFYNVIKEKKLQQLQLGGYDNGMQNLSTDAEKEAFIISTWAGDKNILFTPSLNEGLYGREPEDTDPWWFSWVNPLIYNAGALKIEWTSAAPAIRLKYVFESIFSEHGWRLDSEHLNGTGWEKIFIENTNPLPARTVFGMGGVSFELSPFKWSQFLPAEFTISEFFITICLRYGWIPLFNAETRVCKLTSLRGVHTSDKKDWTKYAASESSWQYASTEKTFAFKNEFSGNDSLISNPGTDGYTKGATYFSVKDFPPAEPMYDNKLIFAFKENAWYKIDLDENNDRFWAFHADNVYDEDIDDATNTFETKATPLVNLLTKLGKWAGQDVYGSVPAWNQSMYEKAGIRLTMYHGMVSPTDEAGAVITTVPQYPFCSLVNVRPDTNAICNDWSNVYRHINTAGTDYGIIEYWFKDWMDLHASGVEEVERSFYLPLSELHRFKWNDIIMVHNIPYFVRGYLLKRPYNGQIQAKMERISLSVVSIVKEVAGIYIKLTISNIVTETSDWGGSPGIGLPHPYKSGSQSCTVTVSCFSDAAAQHPLIPPTGFYVFMRYDILLSGVNTLWDLPINFLVYNVATNTSSPSDEMIFPKMPYAGLTVNDEPFEYDYFIVPPGEPSVSLPSPPATGFVIIP